MACIYLRNNRAIVRTFNFDNTHLQEYPSIGLRRCSHVPNLSLEHGGKIKLYSNWSKNHQLWSKTTPKEEKKSKTNILLYFFMFQIKKEFIQSLLQASQQLFYIYQILLNFFLYGKLLVFFQDLKSFNFSTFHYQSFS